MAVRVVRLGSPRVKGEGPRIGTVRRPPRGVPKAEFRHAELVRRLVPELAPSVATMKLGQGAATGAQGQAFVRKYRAEMSAPEASTRSDSWRRSRSRTDFSVGCYCEHEERCHRSVLRALLVEKGAKVK